MGRLLRIKTAKAFKTLARLSLLASSLSGCHASPTSQAPTTALPLTSSKASPASVSVVPLPSALIVVPGVSASAPRQIVKGPKGPEFVWLDQNAVRLRLVRTPIESSAGASSTLGEFQKSGDVLQFAATRDPHGTYYAALLIQVEHRVDLEFFRSDVGSDAFQRIASIPTIGGHDTHGDGLLPYPQAKDYESLSLAVNEKGVIYIAFTDGIATKVARVDPSRQFSVSGLAGSGQRASLTLDAQGQPRVLQVGFKDCPQCSRGVFYSTFEQDHWRSTLVGSDPSSGVPALVESSGVFYGTLTGDLVEMLELSSGARRHVFGAGFDASVFNWSTLLASKGKTWLVATSAGGLLHAQTLSDDTTSKAERTQVPLVDLFSFPTDAHSKDALIDGDSLYFVYSTPANVWVRRARLPTVTATAFAERMLRAEVFTSLRRSQLRLGHDSGYGVSVVFPHSGHAAILNVVYDDTCVVSPIRAVPVKSESVILPSSRALRLVTPVNDTTWKLEVHAFEPVVVGAPGVELTAKEPAKSKQHLVVNSVNCPGRQYFTADSTLTLSTSLEIGAKATWVGSYSDAAFAMISGKTRTELVKLDFTRTPLGVERVGAFAGDVEPSSLRLRRGRAERLYVAYALSKQNRVTVASFGSGEAAVTVAADDGAFAFDVDAEDYPSWILRRGQYLVYERLKDNGLESKVLAQSDALPLAMLEQDDGSHWVALRSKTGTVIVANFSTSGKYEAKLGQSGSPEIRGAEFYGPSFLALDCQPR